MGYNRALLSFFSFLVRQIAPYTGYTSIRFSISLSLLFFSVMLVSSPSTISTSQQRAPSVLCIYQSNSLCRSHFFFSYSLNKPPHSSTSCLIFWGGVKELYVQWNISYFFWYEGNLWWEIRYQKLPTKSNDSMLGTVVITFPHSVKYCFIIITVSSNFSLNFYSSGSHFAPKTIFLCSAAHTSNLFVTADSSAWLCNACFRAQIVL